MRAPSWWPRRRPAPVDVVAVYEQLLTLADLTHGDLERRRAAERAWLAEHRQHQAQQVAARRRPVVDG